MKPAGKVIELRDIEGQPYQTSSDELIGKAQCWIREQFSTAACLDSPIVAKEHLQVLLAPYKHEVFYAVWLNNRHQMIHHEILFQGTVGSSSVYPREVVKAALACNAAAVIFAHNHPSGSTDPSSADIAITKRLTAALELIDVRILDHLVVGRDVASMAELGLC